MPQRISSPSGAPNTSQGCLRTKPFSLVTGVRDQIAVRPTVARLPPELIPQSYEILAPDNQHVNDHWQPLAGVVDVGQIVEASDGGSDCTSFGPLYLPK